MGDYKRSAALISALGVIIAAAVGGYFAGKGGETVIVQLPNQQQEDLGFREAGERIERLSRDLADAQGEVLSVRSDLDACLEAAPRTERKSTQVSALRQTVDEFLFELEGCEAGGGSLVCTFFVTNNAGDRMLQIAHSSRIVTVSGEEYLARSRELGSRKSRGMVGVELIHGIRTRGALHLVGVPPLSGKIPLVEIKWWASNGNSSVQFRDVPL